MFQARAGAPELDCCSVNAARGFGMIGNWALLGDADGPILNWYGPGTISTCLASGTRVRFVQETHDATVVLRIEPARAEEFTLKLRIPSWFTKTRVALNGQVMGDVVPGTYQAIQRTWQVSDTVELMFDLSLHYWFGEQDFAGMCSVYRGLLLLVYDRRFNTMDPAELPVLSESGLAERVIRWDGWMAPLPITGVPGGRWADREPMRFWERWRGPHAVPVLATGA